MPNFAPETTKRLTISAAISLAVLLSGMALTFVKGMKANSLAHELNHAVADLDTLEEAEPGCPNGELEDHHH